MSRINFNIRGMYFILSFNDLNKYILGIVFGEFMLRNIIVHISFEKINWEITRANDNQKYNVTEG